MERSLEIALNNKKQESSAKAPAEKKKIYADGIQSVIDNKIVEHALQVGDPAVNFTLENAVGSKITLFDELKKGPVILMWYRGGWCPYCNLTLRYMEESLEDFKRFGATLLALTPEVPDMSISTKEKHDLQFEVLSDIDNVIASSYKVVFSLTEGVADIYEKNFKLSTYNGNTKAELPLAATYIIGTDTIIKYAFLDADYRNRAEPADILEFLKNEL